MNKIMKKRQVIMAMLVVALAAAVFVNWYYTKPGTTPVSGTEKMTVSSSDADMPDNSASPVNADSDGQSEYFASVRLQRDTARDQALGNIKTVMANISESESDAVRQANQDLNKLSANIKLESDIEALVQAKLDCDCVAVINGEAIQIVVPKDRIDETSVLQITEIVLDNTDIKSDAIKILGAE